MQKISQEQIEQAVDVDIVDFCNQSGIGLSNIGSRYYRLAEHDSLVIDRKKNRYVWNSRQTGGSSIDFVQDVVLGKQDFKTAVNLLTDTDKSFVKSNQVDFVQEAFEYKNKEIKGDYRARKYLKEVRGISDQTISEFENAGILSQDRYGNAVFKWLGDNRNDIVGASEQGTTIDHDKYGKRGTRKMIQKNSTSNYGVNHIIGDPRSLKFFESSIDMMSYRDLHADLNDVHLISMEGLKHNTVYNYLVNNITSQGKAPDSVAICVDNDAAGHEFFKQMAELEFTCQLDGRDVVFQNEICDKDGCKDYNDELRLTRNDKTEAQKNKEQPDMAAPFNMSKKLFSTINNQATKNKAIEIALKQDIER